MVKAWEDVQAMRRAKALREWLGVTHEQYDELGAPFLEWAEQFLLIDQAPKRDMGEVFDG